MSSEEAERAAIQEELCALVARQRQVTFTDPGAETSTNERSLGVMIARWADSDADSIIDIAAEAFEDANFHEYAAALRDATTKARLEYLRSQLDAEQISQGELIELQGLAEHIEPGDVQLLEAAGVPEFPDDENDDGGITAEGLALGHRYVMGHVNAYCPKCSSEHSASEGRPITVLDCDYDLDK